MNHNPKQASFAAVAAALVLGILAACEDAGQGQEKPAREEIDTATIAPPPLPEGAVSEAFEQVPTKPRAANEPSDTERTYWGIEPGEPLPIMWEDLMPAGSAEALEKEYEAFYQMLEERYASDGPIETIKEGSELDYMPQLGGFETVAELDGVLVRIPGYVVPFDFDPRKRHTTFLLVPYMGACIHSPPPPPNQIIFIKADPAVRIADIWEAYWIEGVLSAETSQSKLADAAYTLAMSKIEPYRP